MIHLATAALTLSLAGSVPGAPAPGACDAEPPPLVGTAGPGAAPRASAGPVDPELRRLWEAGQSFGSFLAAADGRVDLWHRNYADRSLDPEILGRARAVPGRWRLLVIAVAGCSDSVNTVPYLAHLAEAVPELDLRIVDSTVGRAVMEAYPTPDGRAATPTVLLLDDGFAEAGCLIERPDDLVAWFREHQDRLDRPTLFEAKMAWYAGNRGRSTVEDVVEAMEAAAAGRRICGA